MNKIFLFPLLSFCLISCKGTKDEPIQYLDNSPILFSEFLTGSSPDDRAVEIANISNEVMDISSYKIQIYKRIENKPYLTINLPKIELKQNDTFVIAYSGSKQGLKDKAQLVSDDLMVDGTWPLALVKDNKIADILGYIGYGNEFGKRVDLVRKKEFYSFKKTYDPYQWIKYNADDWNNLGHTNVTLSEEELLAGPKLTNESFNTPFVDGQGNGLGGAVEVQLAYVGDGDTTNFYLPSSLTSQGLRYQESVRYLRINTPEIQHGSSIDAQPWGEAAKKYNNDILRKAKHYVLQTESNYAIRDTYSRLLAYVWYSNVTNPSPSDYVLLNNEMLVKGLAFLYFYDDQTYNSPLLYKRVSYTNILSNNELYAKNLGIKVHGEVDPDFDY